MIDYNLIFFLLPKRLGRCNLFWSQTLQPRLANECGCLTHNMASHFALGRSCTTHSLVLDSILSHTYLGCEVSHSLSRDVNESDPWFAD